MAVDTPFVMVILPGSTGTSGKGKGGGAIAANTGGVFLPARFEKTLF
jgi:hypothetical protein